jgi:hypothetical protein
MPRRRHSAEEIVAKLRQADVLLAQGQTGSDVARVLGVTETACATNCSRARSSTRCEKPGSSSKAGGGITMPSDPTPRSATNHQHRRSSCLPSPRGRLRYVDRLRRPRWRNRRR